MTRSAARRMNRNARRIARRLPWMPDVTEALTDMSARRACAERGIRFFNEDVNWSLVAEIVNGRTKCPQPPRQFEVRGFLLRPTDECRPRDPDRRPTPRTDAALAW